MLDWISSRSNILLMHELKPVLPNHRVITKLIWFQNSSTLYFQYFSCWRICDMHYEEFELKSFIMMPSFLQFISFMSECLYDCMFINCFYLVCMFYYFVMIYLLFISTSSLWFSSNSWISKKPAGRGGGSALSFVHAKCAMYTLLCLSACLPFLKGKWLC